jgi:hypothetical protein
MSFGVHQGSLDLGDKLTNERLAYRRKGAPSFLNEGYGTHKTWVVDDSVRKARFGMNFTSGGR